MPNDKSRSSKLFKALLSKRGASGSGSGRPAVQGVAQPMGSRAPRFAAPRGGLSADDGEDDGSGEGNGPGVDLTLPSVPPDLPSQGFTQHTSRFASPQAPDVQDRRRRVARIREGELEDGVLAGAMDSAVRTAEAANHAADKLLSQLERKHDDAETVKACSERLGEQVVWLEGNQALLPGLPLPSADTLNRLYDRARTTLSDPQYRAATWTDRQQSTVSTLSHILDGGPRYLFVLVLLEAIAWQVEVVRADVSGEVQEVVEGLKETREDKEGLKAAVKEVKTMLRGIPKESITDRKAKTAWSQCVKLLDALNQTLKLVPEDPRVRLSAPPKPILKTSSSKTVTETTKTPDGAITSRSRAASLVSSAGTAVTAKTSQSDEDAADEPELFNYEGQVVTRSAMELLEEEADLVKRGLYERDGVLMTASALSLLQAQEMLERGDSAGHGEWGPDTWDGIRGQYIPKWASSKALLGNARKLTVADQWPLVDDDGKRLRDESGKPLEDWFDVNLDAVDEHDAMHFGLEGVVPYPY